MCMYWIVEEFFAGIHVKNSSFACVFDIKSF